MRRGSTTVIHKGKKLAFFVCLFVFLVIKHENSPAKLRKVAKPAYSA